MKKFGLFIPILIGSFLITGCGNKLADLPENPIIFQIGELNTPFEDTGYTTIENDGKTYIIYGGIKGKGLLNDISYAYGDCLGYVGDDKALRIYELKGESADEWLIEYYTVGMMEQPIVLREIDTKNNKNVPSSVESFDYDFWSMTDTIAFNQLKETFTGNIIDGANLEVVDITGDYTLYYNDEFGFATVLGEEWKGYKIRIDTIFDDFVYSGEVIKIKRTMLWFGKFMAKGEPDFYFDIYGFSIINNSDTEKLRGEPVVWTTSLYEESYKGENNEYSFFEASARNGNQRYLFETFPSLDCRTWTGGIEYDIEGNPHEYLDADCNGYEVIDGEVVKTRKSWVEQLFPVGFLFYDV